jgi:hypothetical protein
MVRQYSQALLIALTCSCLAIAIFPARIAFAATDDGSIAAKSDAQVENPATKIATPSVPEKRSGVSDAATEAEQKENAHILKRRAGEQSIKDPEARASVLGMYLQEDPNSALRVVEVGTATPAFDAGVRTGDQILSYQGFSADNYRKWIDGIRKLTTEAPAQSRIPVIVLRDGNRMSLQIRVPDRVVRTDTSRALAQQGQAAAGLNAPLPTGPAGAGNNNVLIDNGGAFGDFFGDQTSPSDAAMAEIVRLNMPAGRAGVGPPAPVGGSTPQTASRTGAVGGTANAAGAAATPGSGARIGVAGFRDDPSGMVVMVDVGALPPGNYSVGISDANVMAGANAGNNAGNVGGANPTLNGRPGSGQSQQFLPPPAGAVPPNNKYVPQRGGAAAPQGTPTGTPAASPTAPAGGTGAPQGSLQMIPRTVLAQVAAGNQAGTTGGAGSSGTGSGAAPGPRAGAAATPTGQVKPIQEPPASQIDPRTGAPGAPSGVNNALQRAGNNTSTGTGATDATGATSGNAGANGLGGAGLNEIGTLTVDQSGTGRLQTTVPGAQVRTVVGQAIVIYTPTSQQQTTLPPNLNGGAGAASRQGVTDATSSARGSQGTVPGVQGTATTQPGVANHPTGTRVPIAAGIIRLISDHRPPTTGTDTTGASTSLDNGTGAAETATPATGQNNLVR